MTLASSAVALFVLAAIFVGARLLTRRYFHEQGRADVAALAIVAAFAAGILVEMPLRSRAPAAAPDTAVARAGAPASVARTPGPSPVVQNAAPESPNAPVAKALGARREARSAELFASLDTARMGDREVALSDQPFLDVPAGGSVSFVGWARDPVTNDLAKSVFVEADRKLAFSAVPTGTERPDIAAFAHNPALAHAGFIATLSASTLGRGTHVLSVLVLSSDGKSYYRKEFGGTIGIHVR